MVAGSVTNSARSLQDLPVLSLRAAGMRLRTVATRPMRDVDPRLPNYNHRYRLRGFRGLGSITSAERGPPIHNSIISGSLGNIAGDIGSRRDVPDSMRGGNETNDNDYSNGSIDQ